MSEVERSKVRIYYMKTASRDTGLPEWTDVDMVPASDYDALRTRLEAAERLLREVRTQQKPRLADVLQWQADCDAWLAGATVNGTVPTISATKEK